MRRADAVAASRGAGSSARDKTMRGMSWPEPARETSGEPGVCTAAAAAAGDARSTGVEVPGVSVSAGLAEREAAEGAMAVTGSTSAAQAWLISYANVRTDAR